jgi:hypothetical protein
MLRKHLIEYLGKLGKLALWQSLGLVDKLSLGSLSSTSLLDLLLQIPNILWVKGLDENIKLGELLLDDGGGRGGTFSLEVIGCNDDSGDCLFVRLCHKRERGGVPSSTFSSSS